jgi:hypothetical protein
MTIDFTADPRDLFKDAARAHILTGRALDAAKAKISAEEAAFENANAGLNWVASHPGLADVDKSVLYQEALDELNAGQGSPEAPGTIKQAAPEEPAEKPKRKRRTKAEMEAARAAEVAEKAAEPAGSAGPSETAEEAVPTMAQPVEVGAPVGTPEPAAAPAAAVSDPFGGAPQAAFDPFGQQAPPAAAADPFAGAGAPAPAAGGFNPFGTN